MKAKESGLKSQDPGSDHIITYILGLIALFLRPIFYYMINHMSTILQLLLSLNVSFNKHIYKNIEVV